MTSLAHAVTTASATTRPLLPLPVILRSRRRRLLREGDGAQGEDEAERQAG